MVGQKYIFLKNFYKKIFKERQKIYIKGFSIGLLLFGGPRHWEHLCQRDVYSDHLLRVELLSLSLSVWQKHSYWSKNLNNLAYNVVKNQHNFASAGCLQIINKF